MTAPILRPYQVEFIEEFNRLVSIGVRRILGVAPTAAGKTVIFADIIRAAVAAQKSVLVISHRREIISQTSQKLRDLDIPLGIILAGTQPRPLELVQVAAIQTLHARAVRSNRMEMPPADLLIFDEAHRAPTATYQTVAKRYPNAIIFGATATPCRGDGRGLGGMFDVIVETPQVAPLIEQGFLVRTRCYAPATPDLKGVRIQAGDYNERQLAERMDRPQLIGDIITNWHKFGENRQTVVFSVSVSHSINIRDEFIKSGVRAEHIDGSTPKPERDATLARLASGEITVVSNCAVLCEGWDMPEAGCGILARPTRKMGLYRQMVGRFIGRRQARPTPSSSTIPARCFATALSKTKSPGRLIRISAPETKQRRQAAISFHRACSNARSAAPCALLAKHASIAASCLNVRRGRSCSPMASLRRSDAIGASARTTTTATNGTRCSPLSPTSAATSRAG